MQSRVPQGFAPHVLRWLMSLLVAVVLVPPMQAGSSGASDYTVFVQFPAPEAEVLQAVRQVAEDQVIHGTFSYEKERTLYGAYVADASKALPAPELPGGKVLYKVADRVLAPRNFKDSGDIGTITVRYVVRGVRPATTSVQIDAVFVDARRVRHPSKGIVESSEYAAIKERLDAIELEKKADPSNVRNRRVDVQPAAEAMAPVSTPANSVPNATSAGQGLEQKVETLRREVVRRVKAGGTELKAAPFKSAAKVDTLAANAEVVVVIVSPYWYGVETEDGHRGWIHQSQVEPVP